MLLCKQDVFSKEEIFLVPILQFRTSSQKPAPQRYIYISTTLWARKIDEVAEKSPQQQLKVTQQ
jgi:hypothetical protein